jgi:hypothetical protein
MKLQQDFVICEITLIVTHENNQENITNERDGWLDFQAVLLFVFVVVVFSWD